MNEWLRWDRAWSSRWYWILGVLVAYELWAALDKQDHTPPLTHVLVAEVPAWVTLTTIAWLAPHFATRYYGWLGGYVRLAFELAIPAAVFAATYMTKR